MHTDTERLDFLIQTGARVQLRYGHDPVCVVNGITYHAPTSREAIDIAITGQREFKILTLRERKSA